MSKKTLLAIMEKLSLIPFDEETLEMIVNTVQRSDDQDLEPRLEEIRKKLVALRKEKAPLLVGDLPKCFYDIVDEIFEEIRKAVKANSEENDEAQ